VARAAATARLRALRPSQPLALVQALRNVAVLRGIFSSISFGHLPASIAFVLQHDSFVPAVVEFAVLIFEHENNGLVNDCGSMTIMFEN
jgi:hypothetical protein